MPKFSQSAFDRTERAVRTVENEFHSAVPDKVFYSEFGGELTPFELKDDSAPGDTTDAYLVDENWDADTSADTFEVVDRQNKHRGIGRSGSTPGSQGIYAVIGGENVIVSMRAKAKRIKAKASGVISGATGTVDNIAPIDDGQNPVTSTADGTNLTVNNPLGHYYADNADVFLSEDGNGSYNLEPAKQLEFTGTLSGSLSVGGSATASLEIVGSVTVYDLLMKAESTAIASGKKITARWFPNKAKWGLTEAECP